ncbi:hypothetical protein BKA67DRAFT_563533 [Truncatella angustata]|uniref:Uncharacterized protein n=1 Tax=Truncatella angustata TaxID=152316 RepID=A0A9P8ZYC3_9PEZI|nr:uncharacterized protein BKA67DRAFT_563533 [Truncatella angustata]KAH6653900.1 hypothetical protein BKA67DRAFT_563533 [Truncatella angustata]
MLSFHNRSSTGLWTCNLDIRANLHLQSTQHQPMFSIDNSAVSSATSIATNQGQSRHPHVVDHGFSQWITSS